MICMFLSNNPSSGDINLSCFVFRETPTSPWVPFRDKFMPLWRIFSPCRPLAYSPPGAAILDRQVLGNMVAQWLAHLPLVLEVHGSINLRSRRGVQILFPYCHLQG